MVFMAGDLIWRWLTCLHFLAQNVAKIFWIQKWPSCKRHTFKARFCTEVIGWCSGIIKSHILTHSAVNHYISPLNCVKLVIKTKLIRKMNAWTWTCENCRKWQRPYSRKIHLGVYLELLVWPVSHLLTWSRRSLCIILQPTTRGAIKMFWPSNFLGALTSSIFKKTFIITLRFYRYNMLTCKHKKCR